MLLLEGFYLSPRQFLRILGVKEEVTLLAKRQRVHGLVGWQSNNAKAEARKFFNQYVQKNSAFIGRIRDERGRYHGASNYFDERFLEFRRVRADDDRLPLADEIVK